MDLLTYEELDDLGFSDITKTAFDDNINNAADAIHELTNHHYHFHSFEDDAPYRQTMFKKAIAAQIRLFNETGANTSYGMNQPQNASIGRTTVNTGGRSGSGKENEVARFSKEAIGYLMPTGLMYRGL